MTQLIEEHIQRYQKYIKGLLENVDIQNAKYANPRMYISFELYACIELSRKYNSIFLCWPHVPPYLRKEKCENQRDMGIDALDIEGNRICQMKLYNGSIPWRPLTTFLALSLLFEGYERILYRTSESKVCATVKRVIGASKLTDSTVAGLKFREDCEKIRGMTFPVKPPESVTELRPYQKEAINYIEKGAEARKNSYLCIPTGCGKTLIILHYHMKHLSETLLVLVPTIVLMEQWGRECEKYGMKPYLIGTHHNTNLEKYKNESIVICVYNSFQKICSEQHRFQRFCIDEAHHVKIPERYEDNIPEHKLAESDEESDEESKELEEVKRDVEKPIPYMKSIQSLGETNRVIYISATLDAPVDGSLFYEYRLRDAISERYLSDYQFSIPTFRKNLSNIDERLSNRELAKFIVCEKCETHCIVYASNCEEGKEFVKFLNGFKDGCAGYIDANTSATVREEIFADFESGKIDFLVNIRVLVEGFNAPHIRSVLFLKVSNSDIFIIQAIGRALRKHEDKIIVNVYIPYNEEDDIERVGMFFDQISTYDERIRETIQTKQIGGYIDILYPNKRRDDEKEETEEDREFFGKIYELVVDRMGNALKCRAIQKAKRYRELLMEKGKKKLSRVLRNWKKEREPTEEEREEHRLATWQETLCARKRRGDKIHEEVERIMEEYLGPDWYKKKDNEAEALERAKEFIAFVVENGELPKRNAKDKNERSLYKWYKDMKGVKNRMISNKKGECVLYPSVEKKLIECEYLGPDWYKKKDNEAEALERVEEFIAFVVKNGHLPKRNAKDKNERSLYNWFDQIKAAKNRMISNKKGKRVLYPSVEKKLIECEYLGPDWYKKHSRNFKP